MATQEVQVDNERAISIVLKCINPLHLIPSTSQHPSLILELIISFISTNEWMTELSTP